MVFSSFTFLFVFLPVVLILYFLSPRKLKNVILLIFSLIFYAWGEPVYVFLMVFSSVVDYVNGRIIDSNRGKPLARVGLISSVIINLAVLGFFKYSDFMIININSIFSLGIEPLNLPLPIGISFYTFQTMSYTIDVYRGKAKVQKNFLNLATYVTLFPQLIAGPIVRYQTIQDQLAERENSLSNLMLGSKRFLIGLFKKVFIANNIGQLWAMVKIMEYPSTLLSWMGIMAFAFQIYYDFSGYSDMAIGLGKMFGFDFLENFNYPYISRSITDFWRRWHISLSSWFRDYLYIPLGGNRVSQTRWYFNIFVVWLATGFWHGASWNFVLWGLYYGLILVIEKQFLLSKLEKLSGILKHLYVMVIVLIGWVLFEMNSLAEITAYMANLFTIENGFINAMTLYELKNYLVLFVLAGIGSTPVVKNLLDKLEENKIFRRYLEPILYIGIFVLIVSYLVNSAFNPFLYFRF